MSGIDRRRFVFGGLAALPALARGARATGSGSAAPAGRPVAIASGNGLAAVARAYREMNDGADPLDAVVAGVNLVEDDPNDMTVGLGGLPNERGVVQLDASVMHGPTHKAGAVAALERIRNPSRVAVDVCRKTDHVLLVGEGALEFARAMGYREESLLTDAARREWLRWKANLHPGDDWLDDEQQLMPKGATREARRRIAETYGTIHCSGVDADGDLGAVTTTSGLSYKIPGRVGDSPIIGAGNFADNEVGSAGATGRGEAVIQSCGAFQVVQRMAAGREPVDACLDVLRWIARHTRRRDLLDAAGRPNFNVVLYALRKDGAFGAASMLSGRTYTVCDANGPRELEAAYLFEAPPPGE